MSEEQLAAALEVGREAVAVEVAERGAKVVVFPMPTSPT